MKELKKKIIYKYVEPAKISWFFFAIDLTTKEEEENVEIYKGKENKNKKKKLKSIATYSHKLTKFHEQFKRIEREQYIEITQSKKYVLITSK